MVEEVEGFFETGRKKVGEPGRTNLNPRRKRGRKKEGRKREKVGLFWGDFLGVAMRPGHGEAWPIRGRISWS